MARDRPVDATPPGLVAAVAEVAADRAVLAPEPLVERLAAEGLTVWLSNPIDAFSRADQAAYLDFLDGRAAWRARAAERRRRRHGGRLGPRGGSSVADPSWQPVERVAGWTVYTK